MSIFYVFFIVIVSLMTIYEPSVDLPYIRCSTCFLCFPLTTPACIEHDSLAVYNYQVLERGVIS